MPSTEYFGSLVSNLGPLTTTFTAAAACQTQDLVIGQDYGPEWPVQLMYSDCDFAPLASDCVPSADEFKSFYTSLENNNKGGVAYFSPASICPSGWETVGVATMSSGSGTLQKSGIFTERARPDATQVREGHPFPLLAQELYLGALQEGENLVYCCPDDHTVDVWGRCLSTVAPLDLESYTRFSTVCNVNQVWSSDDLAVVTFYDGTTWDPPLGTWVGGSLELTTYKETLAPTPTDGYFDVALHVVHSAFPIALINKSSEEEGDNNRNDASDKNNGDDRNDDNNRGGSGDNDGAAPSIQPLTLVSSIVVGLGFLAGMGVARPW